MIITDTAQLVNTADAVIQSVQVWQALIGVLAVMTAAISIVSGVVGLAGAK